MRILSVIGEQLKSAGRVLFNGIVTGTGDVIGILPAGCNGIAIFCQVTMANAADLALTIVSADDSDGTTPVAIAENIPIFVNDVRQTDAKGHTFTDADSVNTVVFCVPAALVPAGKYICLNFANSNDANILSATAFEDRYHESGKA